MLYRKKGIKQYSLKIALLQQVFTALAYITLKTVILKTYSCTKEVIKVLPCSFVSFDIAIFARYRV